MNTYVLLCRNPLEKATWKAEKEMGGKHVVRLGGKWNQLRILSEAGLDSGGVARG
jgi:hypothetical protein